MRLLNLHVYFSSKYFQKPPGERDKNIKDKRETVYEAERDKPPSLDRLLTNGMEKGGRLEGGAKSVTFYFRKINTSPEAID